MIFDHAEILKDATEFLKKQLNNIDVLKMLLPGDFTMPEFQNLYEQILNKKLDRRNFSKKILKTDVIVYFYRCRPESITSSDFSTKKLAWQKHCADNLKFIQKNYPELEADAAARYRDSLLWSLTEIAQSTGDYSEEIRALKAALQRHEQLFFTAPFSYPQDRIRMWFLSKLPFGIYRTLIHLKRR